MAKNQSELPTEPSARVRGVWLPMIVFISLAIFVFRDTASGLVQIWSRSETFAHCFFVLPISAYLLWDKALRIPMPPFSTAWLALPVICILSFVLMVAKAASINVVEQFAFVAFLVGSIWFLLGTKFAKYAAYPLAFLFFAVPFGEGLIPFLIDATTEFLVFGLRTIGIPVYREANDLVLPSGNWSVVTACSGIRYLMATITVSVVYAFLNIPRAGARLSFIAIGLVVAIVGNWMRALGIVLVGHYSDMKYATGADHLIYGWIFFGFLVFVLIVIGETFFRSSSMPRSDESISGTDRSGAYRIMPLALAVSSIVLLTTYLIAPSSSRGEVPQALFALPQLPSDSWREIKAPKLNDDYSPSPWIPAYVAAPEPRLHVLSHHDLEYHVVSYFYPDQRDGFEVVSATNVLVHEKAKSLEIATEHAGQLDVSGTKIPYVEYIIKNSGVESFYVRKFVLHRNGWAASAPSIKRQQFLDTWRGKPSSALVVVFYRVLSTNELPKETEDYFDEMLRIHLDPIKSSFHKML